jgi:hypothetical protein
MRDTLVITVYILVKLLEGLQALPLRPAGKSMLEIEQLTEKLRK